MTHFEMTSHILGLLALAATAWPGNAAAHGTGHRLLKDAPVVALEFTYSDQAPMPYAEVLVYAPQDTEVEHQNGRTDKHGRFVFTPDVEGRWLVKVTDGMGHAEQVSVSVGPELIAGRTEESRGVEDTDTVGFGAIPKGLKTITGISLILNLALAAHLLISRSISTGGTAIKGSLRRECK